ncbi:MAG: hypothetical protein LCH88_09725 [Proteobacteria bacterium]|nr:hypothetical protein [Pseudomonadota bacterium]
MTRERLVYAHHDGIEYVFAAARKLASLHFGGPMECDIVGVPYGPTPLHLIGQLGGRHIPGLSGPHLFGLPLIYGMAYDGCQMTYRMRVAEPVEVLAMQPAGSSENYPYRHFPPLLPYVPLALAQTRPCPYSAFAQRFPNLPERPSGDLLVAVPPPATIGLSLWGSGDWEQVTIVFDCNTEQQTIDAYNVCT